MSVRGVSIFSKLLTENTAAVGPIADTETQIAVKSFAANELKAGDHFRVTVRGLHTNTTTPTTGTYRIRIGSTTLTGNIPAALTYAYGATGRTDAPFEMAADVRIVTVGAGGTALGVITVNHATQAASGGAITSAVAVDTTGALLFELTYQSGGASTTETFTFATIEKVN